MGERKGKVGEKSGMGRGDDIDHLPDHALNSSSLDLQKMHSVVTSGNKQTKMNTHTHIYKCMYTYTHTHAYINTE